MDQAACPPAPAIIMHPALQSTAPASAGKVQYNWLMVKVQTDKSELIDISVNSLRFAYKM